MYDVKGIIGVTGRAVAILFVPMSLATMLSCGAFAAEQATAASPMVRALMTSLAQEWLDEQEVATPAAAPSPQATKSSFEDPVNSGAEAIHDQIIALARTHGADPGWRQRAQ